MSLNFKKSTTKICSLTANRQANLSELRSLTTPILNFSHKIDDRHCCSSPLSVSKMSNKNTNDHPPAAAAPSSSLSPMRKVFSLDCVRRLPRTSQHRHRHCEKEPLREFSPKMYIPGSTMSERGACGDIPSCKATTFSSTAHR